MLIVQKNTSRVQNAFVHNFKIFIDFVLLKDW